ncbi:MAG: hypothetical protein ABSF93_10255, partial [Candidatus Sulfotelmatobacter sp.]
MTNISLRSILLSSILNALVLLTAALVTAAQAQNPPAQHAAPRLFAAPPSASADDQSNFPPQLLDELSAIKTAALA